MAKRTARGTPEANGHETMAGGDRTAWDGRAEDALATLRGAAGGALEAAADAAPGMVAASRRTVDLTVARLQRSSTGSLVMGPGFFGGLTVGLLAGRAPRWLTGLALGPALAFGAALANASDGRRGRPLR